MHKRLILLSVTVLLSSCGDAETSSYDCEVFAQTQIDCSESETQDEFDEKLEVCERIKDDAPQVAACLEAAGTDCSAFLACLE